MLAAVLAVGVAEASLQLARQYSLERQQFDRPIASFQVLKHMMADMYVRTALARSSTYAAAAAQILGGMGFTCEMPSNYLLKRAWVLEESFGTSTTHALSISDSLATTARKAGSPT